jgi:hypothetical protein
MASRSAGWRAVDTNLVGGASGSDSASLAQPKGSPVLGPWAQTEFYLGAGEGFLTPQP